MSWSTAPEFRLGVTGAERVDTVEIAAPTATG
jgi:hypothetical protein